MNFITKLFRHELISGSFYIFLGTVFSSFLAFLLNIYFARTLSYVDYGTFASLLSLVTLITIPSSALSAVIVRYATLFFTNNEDGRAGAFYVKAFKYIFIFSFILNILFLLLFPLISSFLKINELGLIVLVGVTIPVFYFTVLNFAFLQSLLKFKLLGFIYGISGIGKLIVGVGLVFVGMRVFGALFATFAIGLLSFVLSFWPLRRIISKRKGQKVNIGTKDFSSYAIPTIVALFALSSFISTDVLLVKHFFSGPEAGFYGGLSLVGKVIFYFTGPIAMVMFPIIVKKQAKNEKFNKLFFMAVIMVLIPSVFITIFYFIFPEFTIKLFLGGKAYLSVAPYLGIFGIFMTIFSVNNVFVNFYLSIKKTMIWIIVLFWAIAQITGIWYFHNSFTQVIYVSIITSLLLLASLVLYYLKLYGFNTPVLPKDKP